MGDDRAQRGVEVGRQDAPREALPAAGKQTLVSNAPPEGEAASPARAPQAGGTPPPQLVGTTQKAFGGEKSGGVTNIPAEQWNIPFDTTPKSSPGEQILFAANYTDASPNDYQIVYTVAGGSLDSAASGTTTKTIAGIVAQNVAFFIDAAWTGATAVTAQMQIKRVSDSTAVVTKSWTFSKRAVAPTTMTQQETEGERANPAVYNYQIGPHTAGTDSFLHQTILEKFGTVSGNLVVADVKPAYATTHALTTDLAVNNHFYPWGSGSNGTFTVSAGDFIADQHGGMTDKATLDAGLVTPKQFEVNTPQTYEATPGTALGNYNILRILKTDGSSVVKKSKV